MGAAALPILAGGSALLGTGFQIAGQVKANRAQAEAERINAEFYRRQASFSIEAADRASDIFKYESQQLFGDQLSAIARSGLDVSGSPLMFLAQEKVQADKELAAIKREGEVNAELAAFRAGQSDNTADSLTGFSANVLPAVGTVLSNTAQFAASVRSRG